MNDSKNDSIGAVHRFHNAMLDEDIILAYEGEINQNITTAFTSMADMGKPTNEDDYVRQKRLHHVMVECLQNICKHSKDIIIDEAQIERGSGIVIVAKNKEGFEIVTGNKVEKTDVHKIEGMLSSLNSMSPEEIREFYKQNLIGNKLSDKGGAGLGFIDIIKKTGNAIDYSFEDADTNKSFFVARIVIN